MSGGNMERVLRMMADKNASDVFLSANMPILIKIQGQMLQLSDQSLTPGQPRQLLAELLSRNKHPESYEIATVSLRDDSGKARRTLLRDERLAWLKDGRDFRLSPRR